MKYLEERNMDSKRQGEIALELVKTYASKNGLPSVDEAKRRFGNIAKETGISKEELTAFADAILPDLIGRIFGYKSVSMETSR